MPVRDVDKGYRALVDRIFTMGAPKVTVGIFEADAHPKSAVTTDARGRHHANGKFISKKKADELRAVADKAFSTMTVLDIATIQEFGLGNVPERSFLRGWFDENLERAREALVRLLLSVVEGKRSKEQALELFGQWLQGEVQKRIATGIPPALAPSTVAKKGSSTPLIDTGVLRSSITYKIVDK